MSKLLLRAKELGIKDAENLKGDALKDAVAAAETRLKILKRIKELGVAYNDSDSNEVLAELVFNAEQRLVLVKQAEAAGIQILDDMPNNEIQSLLLATENSKLSDLNDALKGRLEAVCKVLSIESHEDLSVEDLTTAVEEKIALSIEVIASEDKKESGKTDQSYQAKSGNLFRFKSKAPASFRFLDVVKSQEEWIQDEEAMELMVLGNLSYVELIRK